MVVVVVVVCGGFKGGFMIGGDENGSSFIFCSSFAMLNRNVCL